MTNKRKICVMTGTRAEYGLLVPLLKKIQNSEKLKLQLIVTGTHLSPEFGLTYKEIPVDGFGIDRKIEMLLSSDSPVGIGKSMGVAQIGFADAFEDLKPDMLVVLGDRFEILSAVSTALIFRIPVAHIHGGELTEGAVDDAIRHAVSKMSHLHFTATDSYRNRVIQLGEQPDTVYRVGALGLENINNIDLLEREEFEKSIDFKLGEKNLLVTFHPETLGENSVGKQFGELLDALDSLDDTKIIFTKPNADTDGRIIIQMIDEYVKKNRENTRAFSSLGQVRFLSALQFMDGVVGNSSSGIIEVPSFGIGTVNIGDRQKGRLFAESVISCRPERKDIEKALEQLYKKEFRESLNTITNPYMGKDVSRKIVTVIEEYNWEKSLKKSFYDIEFS
ncbi:UDP-N-acetyl glucosamine 2-epimerase [Desulfomarina profundi]|uniref:UDP-N-acetyl glucosamine 2-epimerase n=1 Tax=Desulfomarina profundi TaxID=2772557 RepID=A0A8D5FLY3_9BACT|nr:UDP-N-acetylglucosamine 2-epimerase [Desulfomarina profundi]BCL60659.1 UDP-N-acetyl glucosamine 2-epimerase [Desulfomarina profundi]